MVLGFSQIVKLDTLLNFSYALGEMFNPFKIFFGTSTNELEENELNVMSPDTGVINQSIVVPIKEPIAVEGLVGDSSPSTPSPEKSGDDKDAETNKPITQDTINEITDSMRDLPRLSERSAFRIPYRSDRRTPIEVFDEVTGLNVEAAYDPEASAYYPLKIYLSTPKLSPGEDHTGPLGRMDAAMKEIYGDSEHVDSKMRSVEYGIKTDRSDRAKFAMYVNKDMLISSDFGDIKGDWELTVDDSRSQRPVTENGGKFLKGIIERAVRKQKEDYEQIRVRTNLVIEKVKDEAIIDDPEKGYGYAYHSTHPVNIPSISESGLQPSGSGSKEPGTIFFTGWDSATTYQPEQDRGVVYRFHLPDMPEIARSMLGDDELELRGIGNSVGTTTPIPPDKLNFSLDSGKTWMPVVSRREQGIMPATLPKAA